MSMTATELATRWVDQLVNTGDFKSAADIVAVEFIEHALAPFGTAAPGSVDGPAHTSTTMGMLRAQFPDLQMEVEAAVAEGDEVVLRVTASGTHLGALNGVIAPTGARFEVSQCHWFRVRGGRLAEHWAVRDDLTTMVQLRVLEPPSPGPPALQESR